MIVRGAPAIGITAAYGICLALYQLAETDQTRSDLYQFLDKVETRLASTRPTAVNLFWALKRMRKVWTSVLEESAEEGKNLIRHLVKKCESIRLAPSPKGFCHLTSI